MSFIQQDLSQKKKELQDVKDEEAAQNAENNRQKLKIKGVREKNKKEGIAANSQCVNSMTQISDLEKQLEAARKKNHLDTQKTKQLRTDFTQLKTNYQLQIEELRKKLVSENQRRESNQT